ncbi:LysR family transcriptional regulator [Pseudoroseomonas wenyumeiae]|uniref:LysR family transcriptional regulator n=2 Tax=Teichococcus wenyumeiae TaxID=2478470 RepID=A0A3A9JT23_9PROT|nr:LysR family transcriptional regulator [Pseudoroseomonas wenyumeiae]RMI15486.1 LysR family transcriptional regulator [Pseudoroseomonas wenyumeiae]
MTFDLREMEVFRRVMELGSVTAAAAALNISQPAVTRMLQKTEQRLGFALFVREKRRLRPTAEAQIMFPDTLGAFSAIEQVQRLAGELREGRAGILAIATIPALAASILPDAVQRFRAKRPEASVTLQTFGAHEVIQRVASHRDDLGFIIGPVGNDAVLVTDLRMSELTCVLPPAHPLASRPGIGPAELAGVPIICPGRHLVLGDHLARAFAEANVPFQIAVEVSHTEAACALVRAGTGVGIISGFGFMGARATDLVGRPFRPAIVSTARLLRARLRPLSRLAQTFVEGLEAAS